MKQQSIWISYDLGIKGDYPGLYRWLDGHKARECGDSIAFLKYSYEDDLIEELKKDISESIELNKRDRIYVTFKRDNEGDVVGVFIVGNRKASPWEGYAPFDNEKAFDE
jgi:hypothetical protein